MKLTKKVEQEVLKVYNTGWDAYMRGDLKTHGACLSSKFKIIGTTEAEHFNSKKAWLAFCKKTMHQVVGVVQMRNRKIKLDAVGDGVMVVENSAIYVLLEGKWQFYSRIRITALMEKEKSGWKYVHQHGSLPDTRASENETIATERIKKENQQLRDAVKRRTIELEEKNRELEIEASLEKVRAQALGMRTSEDLLHICRTLYKELSTLGITSLRNTVIHVFHDERACFTDHEYSDSTGGNITTVPFKGDATIEKFIKRIRKSENAFVELKVEGKELSNWKLFRKRTGQIKDNRLKQTQAIHYYIYSVGHASIGISSFDAIEKDKKELLKRFRNVFDFAYRRYTDVALAQAQAREAKIEASVERVRACAMAMHKSEEVLQVIVALKKELTGLNLEVPINAATIFLTQNDGTIRMWDITSPDEFNLSEKFDLIIQPEKEDTGMYFMQIWKSRENYTLVRQDKSDLKRTVKWLRKHDQNAADEIEQVIITNKITQGFHPAVRLSHGWLCLDLTSPPPYELKSILIKMGAAFDLAYQRFLDLQKAEAQTREAQIEASLERIRAQAMALRNSGEWKNIIRLVFQEWKKLGVSPYECSINVIDRETREFTNWATGSNNESDALTCYKVQPWNHSYLNDFYRDFFAGVKYRTDYLTGKRWISFLDGLFTRTDFREASKAYKEQLRAVKAIHVSHANNYHTSLDLFDFQPLSKEQADLMVRIAAVVEMAYTRYLDIKTAEAQTREAQIQLSLERVRSRAMAMHQTEELTDVLSVLFDQFDVLGITPSHATLSLIDPTATTFRFRMTGRAGKRVMAEQVLNLDDIPEIKSVVKQWRNGKPNSVNTNFYAKEVLPQVWQLFSPVISAIPAEARVSPDDFPEGMYQTEGYCKFGYLGFAHHRPSTEEEKDIVIRFATEFGRLYQRFLDLQKAELQAREAQIEVAVERVRAKALAMHKSEEIMSVVKSLHRELDSLKIPGVVATTIYLKQDDGRIRFWDLTTLEETEEGLQFTMDKYLRLEECPDFLWFQRLFRQEDKYLIVSQHEEELKRSLEWIRHSINEEVALSMIAFFEETGSWHLWHPRVLLENGVMNIDFIQPPPAEAEPILIKMGAAFDLAYKRFLDLQKAEEQAREAQIEAALERVRSRAMAMHRSEELESVIRTVFDEWKKLGLELYECNINIVDSNAHEIILWSHGLGDSKSIKGIKLQLFDHPFLNQFMTDFQNQASYRISELSGKYLKDYLNQVITKTDFRHAPEDYKEAVLKLDRIFICDAFMKYGAMDVVSAEPLPGDKIEILIRFAKVFEQTYTRFLDLQKAEAQAREAQIEVAVERVRAKALAMHKSEEVLAVVVTLKNELSALKLEAVTACTIFLNQDDGTIRMWDITALDTSDHSQSKNSDILIPPDEFDPRLYFMRIWHAEGDYTVVEQNQQDFERTLNWFRGHNQLVANEIDTLIKEQQISMIYHPAVRLTHGWLCLDLTAPPAEELKSILPKMASAFDLAYQRFLDLQKAEAQAREAEIQLALERVRARTLAMYKSEELSEAAYIMMQQFNGLGEATEQITIAIVDESKKAINFWVTFQGQKGETSYSFPVDEPHVMSKLYQGWKNKDKSLVLDLSGMALKQYLDFKNKAANIPPEFQEEETRKVIYSAFFSNGFITLSTDSPRPASLLRLLERFAAVFELTYTRFLDLKKAEAQAREAQIEAALEKVRASMMAMHHSETLPEVMKVIAEQLIHLGIPMDAATFTPMNGEKDLNFWSATTERTYPVQLVAPYIDHTLFNLIYEAKTKQYEFITINLTKKDCDTWWNHFFTNTNAGPLVPEHRKEYILSTPGYATSMALGKNSTLNIVNYAGIPFSSEENAILKRFATVFDQSYTRFLDLQKAEAQAREAQIEAALERVRSRSLAMHKSDEIKEIVKEVFEQLKKLSFAIDGGVFIGIPEAASKTFNLWVGDDHAEYPTCFMLPYYEASVVKDIWNATDAGLEFVSKVYNKEEKNNWFAYAFAHTDFKTLPDQLKEWIINQDYLTQTFTLAKYSGIGIHFHHQRILLSSEVDILKRFSKVFEQGYVRFLDLQNAEAQAREAQIEAALEKVRSRAMAMQKSDELLQVIKTLSEQLWNLGLHAEAVSFLTDGDERGYTMWLSSPGEDFLSKIYVPRIQDRTTLLFQQAKETGKRYYSYVLSKEEKDIYFQNFFDNTVLRDYPDNGKEQVYDAPGMTTTNVLLDSIILSVSNFDTVPFSDQENEIINRIAFVFQQTYTRFLDLQKAEAQAKEAVKQSSLDRIRGEIASMRTTNDLERITPLIWKELTTLNIPFIRCGVFIMDDQLQQIHTFLSTPDGKAIAAFHLPYDAQARTREILHNWIHKQAYIEHWDEFAFSELGDLLVQQGALASKDVYLKTIPPGGLYLHCLPFMQGMLYVGNTVKLNEDEIQLIQSVADAFATAYARYQDFNKLEAAKQQVDKALVELKQTQQQLIQSEKMASLGELTAGIAHEIQNPLNFVNNFSEVSNELLDEMNEELSKGDIEKAKLIANDVKQNLEKILHHGKRADGIVKGMLQHSRSSSGTKEPTDINALVDEYLRLAYHGLRAKDKSFNAKFETHFDESIGKVEMVPQDVGRVILNLITNAFYVVTEKKKQNPESYEPTVRVSSKKVDGKVELSVKDNGLGIPNHIKEKIFQPFFTTKPTGQGTGLGLSLSYDIVKAHGGELSVETKEGEGSVFIISLPFKNAI
jgi:signal transduction histidine kinase